MPPCRPMHVLYNIKAQTICLLAACTTQTWTMYLFFFTKHAAADRWSNCCWPVNIVSFICISADGFNIWPMSRPPSVCRKPAIFAGTGNTQRRAAPWSETVEERSEVRRRVSFFYLLFAFVSFIPSSFFSLPSLLFLAPFLSCFAFLLHSLVITFFSVS